MGHFWSWAGGVFVEQESKSDMISGKSHYIRVTSAAIVAFEVQWLTKRNVSNFIWIGLKVITELQRPSSIALACNVMCRDLL